MIRVRLELEIAGGRQRLFLSRYVDLPFAPFEGLMIDGEEVAEVWHYTGNDEYSGTRCKMLLIESEDPEEDFEEAYEDEWVKCDCCFQPLAVVTEAPQS